MTDEDDEPAADAEEMLGEVDLLRGDAEWVDETVDSDDVEVSADEATNTVSVTVDGETTEYDAAELPFDPPWKHREEEFSPRMQARLGASRELNALRERFGMYELVEERTVNEPELYEGGLSVVEAHGMLADAGAIVRDDERRVLLVRHPEVDGWGHPSAMYEGETSLVETAEREVSASTGVDATMTGFCYVREKHIVREVDREIEPGELAPPSYPMVTVVFAAEGDGEVSVSESAELTDARWFDEPPADVNSFTAELLDRC